MSMKSTTRLSLIAISLALFASLAASPSHLAAQDVASLTGIVTDASGAVVADAQVNLVDTKTNTAYDAKTNSVGAYLFTKLLPGPGYKLTITKEGFDTMVVPSLYLAVNTTHTQNAQLRIGRTTETVEVKGVGSAVSLNTNDATVGNNFDMNMVHELPVQVRDNPTALLGYQPGVLSLTTGSQSGDDTGTMSRNGSITGARTDQSNVTLDGLDVNDFCCGFAFTVVGNAPIDSVQEFRGEVANPLSTEGRGSGAQIALVTKSGTNSFHGSAYEYYRTRGFEANDFFNNFATPVVPREALVRNQFGADLGGPVIKDKLFFFFNYQGRRDAHSLAVLDTVPLNSFKQGNIAYINSALGVSVLPATGAGQSVKAFDPLGIGADPKLTSFLMSRYPTANSTATGDGLNTGGLQFNAPDNDSLNDYVARLDYNWTSKMKLFARGSMVRRNHDYNNPQSIQFPGDPLTQIETDHSYAYVVGHTWTISNTKVNQFVYGETRQELNFPFIYNPNGTTQYVTFDGNGTGFSNLTSPYAEPASQGRTAPVPVYRDDFTYVRGTHTFQVGGNFKPIKLDSYLITDFNFPTVGLGGSLTNLGSSSTQLRPSDLLSDPNNPFTPVAQNLYDSAYSFILGEISIVNSSYNNNRQLQPFPQGTGHRRSYRYYETEAYVQDSWKARSDLTLTYGLRYQFYSVPYETNGLEAVPDLDFSQIIQPRLAHGVNGVSGFFANPIVTYSLGGKVNHGAPLYHPDWHDFQPRLAFAYNPSAKDGALGRLLGDRKTVIRGGFSIIDDHTAVGALNFLQDQNTWILQSASAVAFANSPDATVNLSNPATRFVATNVVPAGGVSPPPAITVPFSPAFVGGNPWGLASFSGLAFNYAIDPGLKTPYSEAVSFGIQRELPGNFQLDLSYAGRFAHRLLARADAFQTVNFIDPKSRTDLNSQFVQLEQAVRSGQPIPTLPFFENTMNPTMLANPNVGLTCEGLGFPNCASLVAAVAAPLPFRGDLADTLQVLNGVAASPGGIGLIAPGVGLSPQFGSGLYVTNKGFSNYNGLLATLHKKTSYGLQFDVNYTWSHSLDNFSSAANNGFGNGAGAGGIMCDSINVSVCYANSDFDVQHNITGDWVYDLPFGRGRSLGSSMPRWADEVVGGWSVTGLFNWRTGLAFGSVANAFPISFANNVPAVFNGDTSAIKVDIHHEINASSGNNTIQLFKSQTAALGAFTGPLGIQAGTRNNLRGPHYSDFDIGLAKHFPVTERAKLEFRADVYNVFNHTNFELPGNEGTADISSPSTFGVITADYGARVMQLALRLDF